MIDNYDSFTYNLVQYFGELGVDVTVYRNDELAVSDIVDMRPERIVISPGPCTPGEAGISVELVRKLAPRFPILGVCLGHQCIAQAFGARIDHARAVMHGKPSMIYHDSKGIFEGIDGAFEATRYHSLVVAPETLPECLVANAWTHFEHAPGQSNGQSNGQSGDQRDEIMALHHRVFPVTAVQFHPESILTEHGHQLLQNFVNMQPARQPVLTAVSG
jgi:anthranilate synthase component 2